MSKHTEGPWAIRREHSVVEIRTTAGLPIAQTTSDAYWENFKEESLANARLIAAAPELLDALKRIEDYDIDYALGVAENMGRIQQIARASIAKAEGRS